MSRYTGPKWKLSRRLGFSILEDGRELKKRPYAPGQHGQRKKKLSDYGLQLYEKQKVRHLYGVSEKQFYKTFLESKKIAGVIGENFLRLLESRLDNVIYRMGFARTRAQARQLVNHGHVLVNGKRVDIPSFRVKPKDKISLKEKSKSLKIVLDSIENNFKVLDHINVNMDKREGTYLRHPDRKELNPDINEQLIIEFYNRA